MDRFDRIIRDIQKKSQDNQLDWKLIQSDQYTRLILNPIHVLRAFKTEYRLGAVSYELLFLEKRSVAYQSDFDEFHERSDFELLVLDKDGQPALTLYDGIVERDDLLKLAGIIDDHNDRARGFFKAFDESGAA